MVACIAHPILSRTSHTIPPHIPSPERFALHLGTYLISKYTHIHRAFVSLEKLRWSCITLSGHVDPHPHSFIRDRNDKQTVEVEVRILILILTRPMLLGFGWTVNHHSRSTELDPCHDHRRSCVDSFNISPVANPHGRVIAYDPAKYPPFPPSIGH
ncbi:hypothetical protein EDD22DRAFT_228724 [Suillus occidentalis]|nr:hypothetical protein EDD22DRAFT_228724 [Suillus occidentalis]